MVATRRTAPKGADTEMADPELALKKKPARKATAKTAVKAEAAPKAKTTRGKKTEAVPVDEAPEVVEEAPKTRGRGRPKKAVEVAVEPEPQPEPEEPTKPANATRATKTGSVRGRKAAVVVEEAPELPAAKEAKPARQTRATASKATPLSPKKITQVAKPQTRNAKTVGPKPAAKAVTTKASVRGRAAARGRKVSDENAEVSKLAQPVEEDDSVVVVSSTPVKKPAARRQAAKKQEADESEVSMSTRATTPTASPVQSQQEEAEHEAEESSADLPTPEKQNQTVDNDDSDSGDELCGPKTPMRRGSPGAEARYHSSAQRTIRKYDEEQRMQTPARRYAVLGSQRGTPQTQKPYCKPAAPTPELRPMTVARGANRAFVFRDLRDGVPELPRPQMQQESIAEEEDLSFIPDDNIISMASDDEGAALAPPTAPAPLQLASPPTSSTDIADEDDEQDDLDSVQSVADGLDLSADDDVDDLDTTVIIEDNDEGAELDIPPQHPPAESFETEDTVVITRAEQAEAADLTMSSVNDDSEVSVIHIESSASLTPETMVWENVQPEHTIAVNFDDHLNEARTLPEPERTEMLDITSTLDDHLQLDDVVTTAKAEEVSEHESEQDDYVQEIASPQQQDTPAGAPSMDLNEYFDMAALTEPTQVIDFAPQPDEVVDTEMGDAPLATQSGTPAADEVVEHSEVHEEPAVCPEEDAEELSDADTLQEVGVSDQLSNLDNCAIEEEDDQDIAVAEPAEEAEVPHYARCTFAFDARRKSLPATSMFTPVRLDTRPTTSDGASMPRMANPFGQTWWARSRANSTAAARSATPYKSRPSAACGAPTSGLSTPCKAATPAAVATPVQQPKERYPALGSRSTYIDHSQTAAPPSRFQDREIKLADKRKTFHRAISGKTQPVRTPAKSSTPTKAATPVASPKERYPALGSRTNYVDHAKTVAPPARFQDWEDKPANRRRTFHRAISGKAAEKEEIATPAVQTPSQGEPTPEPQQTPVERFPRLRSRAEYEDHAKTVAAPRFSTPAKSPLKRPATTQKPTSMRKAALRNSTATPMKTPLKAPAMTPGQEPMTPHPAIPLRGVIALVEVYTLEGASASSPFTALLHRLGAKTTRAWTDRVTHVIFKDGSPTTLQRVRLHNKDVAASGNGTHIFCVNSRWVSDCDTVDVREDETDEAYAVDVEEVPRGGKRRRKSMEPSALMNMGGNVVRDRKSSLGRSSLGRSSIRFNESPAKKAKIEGEGDATPGAEDKENSDEEPATPAWIAEPSKLVQMTAPMKRVRKLELPEKSSRRLTFWDGGN